MASPARRVTWLLGGAVVIASCGKQTGDEGQSRQARPSYIVENEVDDAEQAPAGMLDNCFSESWPATSFLPPQSPDTESVVAICVQRIHPDDPPLTLSYVCTCDNSECPLVGELVDHDEDPNTPPESPLTDCGTRVIRSVLDAGGGCRDALLETCGIDE
jgi:hypothetical protein